MAKAVAHGTRGPKICTILVSIAARQPIGPCLLGPSSSLLGKGSGRVGRHPTANSLPGSPLIIAAGPPIGWPSVGYLISLLAPSVIRMGNLFIISLRRVCSPGRSGLGAPESEPYSSNSSRRFEQASRILPKGLRKGFNSLVILVSWELWKHRNTCTVLTTVASEGLLWCRAGASGLQELLLRAVPGP
ncbi:hypothetical protein U9M48_028480 [Paspalum notatum var. saurae]|uniref:Uncharacterized protein n=1 Tax=Paspalum notatum var. saurae TaxID=547442 RepID=A0AAQ3TYJ6_PASNO